MKAVKTFGLVLFLVGFGIFNATFFTANYQLTNQIITNQIGDQEKVSLFKSNSEVLDKTISSNFTFVSELEKTFEKINEVQLDKFSISDGEIDKIINANNESFSLESLAVLGDGELADYKRKTFNDYGNWLDGRTFNSKEEMKTQVSQVVENIKKYQIVNEKGFDQYKIKDLKYSLTKASAIGPVANNPTLFLVLTYVLCIIGAFLYIVPKINDGPPGIKNNGIFHSAMKNTGWLGILTGAFLIAFYIVLYFYPEYMTNWIIMVDPISQFLKGSDAGRFFLYGFIYTLCILVMGARMIIKYRHSKYQIVRTISVMFFQTAFAFLIPEILLRLNQPYFDFKNIWPLDYDFFFDNELDTLLASGSLGIFMLGWGIALIIIGVPVFVYFFGKRWYCSWVCGCGGLAETLGDPYRQLSDKSLKAWKVERWMIHSVLVFAVVMTGGVLYTYWTGNSQVFGFSTYDVRSVYGAWIGAGFAGVVGTGFYPLMGNRVWCRFGCPLAAYLGIIQRFKSRFRITTNGGQCISCGNCSTYCEMGIDVRWYAQRGQNIIRSSCVGCGVCSSVCPRGVLNLENKDPKGRFNEPILIGNNGVQIKK
ncbi:4Fe-4S binding protein [Fulvivirga lutea]|uniref:4Fe-4S binding protein n=1 Tax=Fulvivirga lutea TaxID=2810512 RepID=A0A975A0W0_9BACT|nr:4Fe-4S dicluster domain-containing protein [Fulvivirga lutea]QSE97615.1 4Fe-4S binding protein [Fulvivirga lutea]